MNRSALQYLVWIHPKPCRAHRPWRYSYAILAPLLALKLPQTVAIHHCSTYPRARHVEGHADILIAFGGQDIANNEASNLCVHALLEGSDVWVRLADFSGFAPHGKFQPNFIGTVRPTPSWAMVRFRRFR